MKNPLTLLLAIGLASCAPPKAIIVAEDTVKPAEKAVATVPTQEPGIPAAPDDGLRLPDMLALPDEAQLRSSPGTANGGDAPIITRPPEE